MLWVCLIVPGHSTSPSGAWTTRSCSRGTIRESRIVIAWLSLPPEELIAIRAPRRINRRHSREMGISVAAMVSVSVWMECVG